ncbi:acyl-CoA dehydrogenase family protein [Mycolicibacterium fortuitum]|uniref:Acyl-CoA dehydrogenase n=1 Tax=Mycolicibacterium fortuitum subsp. fortuitum DSM 46621 = ATCC 6841 = JCM 6387 TaxID=1214102 RepID=K0UUJ2_MYCFO|nr:acyl-CoA dehydrogenase family protein [Mycolicibacterium fortuitum]AIY47992.1 Butyryl-CoA dehydrogenase [Mycobacterium sp. VKM Ac-1817D]CRL82824.1 acyl-CoA dehydrogenase [Mycolicibacter nonchromogenicus]EJZ06273.1 acyl-CoA dehydrogenase [Mycolicibacterium fortuitum subsp. fortuitum DSM 46621 = ATCC 6841 = JCM 6387]WEV31598.1 acyl-CoA/acyl-ACP dehydrogenase [Mycolicibacterium fortuitum]CRL53042.1 acyl-CoA dehydrogenase [Mycolicibacterium fortuitum subsp. fortuitum DSM 46621 = ATCC 6841 = JCM
MADTDQTPNASEQFAFTPEQQELRTAIRGFCAEHSDEATIRQLMESRPAFDQKAWTRIGSELGVLGLGVPEELDGSGGGLVDAAIVVEELGAALFCGPVFGTLALSIPALVAAPESPVRTETLAPLVAGTRAAAFAVPDRGGRFAPDAVSVRATSSGDTWTLSGTVARVVDADAADTLLVTAVVPDGVSLFVVDATESGVERTVLSTMDLTRPQATVEFFDAPARLLADSSQAPEVCQHALHVGSTLLAAEQVGAAQHLLDLSVAYAKERLQFGRPIGSFQAVKHRIADMLVEQEHARSAAYYAAWALQDRTDNPALVTSIAQATCSAAFTRIATDTVQVHGGIGFTWEHQTHLYFKRAFTDAALLGSAEEHRSRIAELVLDGTTTDYEVPVATG